ncbi:unnamed protein product [Phytomonas sp. Hart1]|nr:unnamed protein product [Phytomonas sp. Hart1]|eukprot:CCW67358.1 unnamed protein product [Phytomonas sp. isolate Hart1]
MSYIINELCRFRMLVGGVYLGIAISSSYGFSIFTEYLKSKYGFTQSEINTISTVGNCAGYLCFFAGMLFDYIGPRVVILISGCLGTLGFLLYGLAFDDIIPNDNNKNLMLFKFCIFNVILYFGSPSLDVCALMSLMLNFPLERGYMVIIQKTFSGLGTAVIMAYFNAWFYKSSGTSFSSYAYFLAAQFALCAFAGFITIDLPPYYMCDYTKRRISEEEKAEREETRKYYMTQHAPKRRLLVGCMLTILLLIFAVISSIILKIVDVTQSERYVIGFVALFLVSLFTIMAFPFQILGRYTRIQKAHPKFPGLGLPYDDNRQGTKSVRGTEPDEICNERMPYSNSHEQHHTEMNSDLSPGKDKNRSTETGCLEYLQSTPLGDSAEEKKASTQLGDPQIHGSFWSHLLTPELWLLWVTFFGVWGTATVMIMNAAQLYRSINMGAISNVRLSLYITVISLGSAIGRLTSGLIDMWLINKRLEGQTTMLITTFFPLSALFLTLGYFLFSVVGVDFLILPFLLVSVGNGMGWGMGSLTVRVIYAEDIGKHYNFMFFSGFVCTIALNLFMFGGLYDSKARKYGTSPACNHPDCVRPQMWILMAVNLVSLMTSLILHFRFRGFVQRELLKRKEEA